MNLLVKLFLNTTEQEELMKLHDTLWAIEVETEDQHTQRSIWCSIITKLIFGKNYKSKLHYPVMLDGSEQETK